MAIFQEYAYAASPAKERVSRISSGAYATEDKASEANTGSAIRLGSNVSPSCVLRSLRPSSNRLLMSETLTTYRDSSSRSPRVAPPSRVTADTVSRAASLDSHPCTS